MPVKTVRAVSNALRVVEALATEPGSGVSALARRLELDKMAVQRILVTLAEAAWIEVADGEPGRWELSSRLAGLGRGVAPNLRAMARAHLERMAAETGETVLLFAVDARRAVVVDAIDSPQPLRMTVPIGTDVPLGTELARYFEPGASIEPDRYFVIEDEYPDAVAVGVPIFHVRDGTVPTGTITVVGPRSRLPHSRLESIGKQLVKIAHVFAAAP